LQPVRCIECVHANMCRSKTWAAMGCCVCALGPNWHYMPLEYPRECGKFAPAPADAVAKRRAWLLLQRK